MALMHESRARCQDLHVGETRASRWGTTDRITSAEIGEGSQLSFDDPH